MAASTITRATWTNDSGTPSSPVGDGTLLNNTRLQNDVYAKIDEMFAGAGSYATFTFGGFLAVEGFGSHLFSAGGTGGNLIMPRNTTAGTGNYAGVRVGNDATNAVLELYATTTTYTASGDTPQDGSLVRGARAGGLSISATDAAGVVRFYTGGTTERMRLTAAGMLLLGDTSNASMTVGLTLNQGAADDEILALKSSDVAHGIAGTETDTYGAFKKADGSSGGLSIVGWSEVTAGAVVQLQAIGATGSGDTTKSTAGLGYLSFSAFENNGNIGADENIAVFRNSNTTRFILDADGDSHQDVGTAWTNFHGHDDIELLNTMSAHLTRKDDPLRVHFTDWLESNREPLERMKLVTFNDDGHHFLNHSRLNMLNVGAILQLAQRLGAIERQLGIA